MQPKKLIIAGGGFAGINLALALRKNRNYAVTLIDRNNYNYFPPLLYQVSTAFLNASSISFPFRKFFRGSKLAFRMGEIASVDPVSKKILLDSGELSYDYLVFATGAQTNFFGMENIRQNALPMKTIDDAMRLRNALLKTLEQATVTNNPDEREQLLTVVIAGGGPTGVEVSGMLAEMKNSILKNEYPELGQLPGEIYIVDGGKYLLNPMSDKTHRQAAQVLEKLGVKIRLNTTVRAFNDGNVELSSGELIKAAHLIWAAGITANTFEGIPGTSLGPGNRMLTDSYNKVKGLENVYAIGDGSIQYGDTAFPKGHPQLAQVAIQQGKCLGKNFVAMQNGKSLTPFRYWDKGDMAIIGRHFAVVDLFNRKFHISGQPALAMWLLVHLLGLIHYSNRLRTLMSWT